MLRTSFSRKTTYIYYTNSLSRNIIRTGEISPFVRFINNTEDIIKTDANIKFINLPINEINK